MPLIDWRFAKVVVEMSHVGPMPGGDPAERKRPPRRPMRILQMGLQRRPEADALLRVKHRFSRLLSEPPQDGRLNGDERARPVERRV